MKDITIAYRIYSGIAKNARSIYTSKFRLALDAVNSFTAAIGGASVKLYVILDDCPEYTPLFAHLSPNYIKLSPTGNRATFLHQLKLLCDADTPLVMFVEDDYLWKPKAIEQIVDFMTTNHADFATPYDEPNYYHCPGHRLPPSYMQNWRTVSSTTCTFAANTCALKDTRHVFARYYEPFAYGRITDLAVWLSLTKPPPYLLKRFWAWSWLCATTALRQQYWNGPTYLLWAPTSSLADHIVENPYYAKI